MLSAQGKKGHGEGTRMEEGKAINLLSKQENAKKGTKESKKQAEHRTQKIRDHTVWKKEDRKTKAEKRMTKTMQQKHQDMRYHLYQRSPASCCAPRPAILQSHRQSADRPRQALGKACCPTAEDQTLPQGGGTPSFSVWKSGKKSKEKKDPSRVRCGFASSSIPRRAVPQC